MGMLFRSCAWGQSRRSSAWARTVPERCLERVDGLWVGMSLQSFQILQKCVTRIQ